MDDYLYSFNIWIQSKAMEVFQQVMVALKAVGFTLPNGPQMIAIS